MSYLRKLLRSSAKSSHRLRYFSTLKKLQSPPLRNRSDFRSSFHHKNAFNSIYTLSNDVFTIEFDMKDININSSAENNNIKMLLYPSETEPLLSEIRNCDSVQEVFDIVNRDCDLDRVHVCQMILNLWYIQKEFCDKYIKHLERVDFEHAPEQMLTEFTEKLKSQREFNKLLQLLDQYCPSMNTEELSFCTYYLRKLKFPYTNELIIKLIGLVENKLQNAESEWSLSALMRYTSALKCSDSLRLMNHMKVTIPLILEFLEKCETEGDFKDVTICMKNVHILMTKSSLEMHKKICYKLINSGTITKDNHETILWVIDFYNLLHWSKENTSDISYLCLFIKDSIKNMDAIHLIYLHKVFQIQLSPATIVEEIKKRVMVLLEEMKYDQRINTYLKLPDLLYCQASTSPLKNKKSLENITESLLMDRFSINYLSLYKTLRVLKTTNVKICDLFWKNAINDVLKHPEKEDFLLQLCFKYLYFNNNIGMSYRNQYFENLMLDKLLVLMETCYRHVPWKFSRASAFIFAYGLERLSVERLNDIIYRLSQMSESLNAQDLMLVTKGLHISSEFLKWNKYTTDISYLLSKMNIVLDDCSRRLSNDDNLSLTDLNHLFKSQIIKKSNYQNEHFLRLISRFHNIKENLTPRLVKDMAHNFISTSTISSKFLDQLTDYIISQKDDNLGEISQKIMIICYLSGHRPKNNLFFHYAVKTMERDQELVSGLSLLDGCIAMCYFGCLPESLTKTIFSLEFMERIDKEIENCYSIKTYPLKLRKRMMLLNRAVCLDLPQYEIPWFHKKYTEEVIALASTKRSVFFDDVLDVLISIVGKKEMITNTFYAPYGYKIDFLLHLNKNGLPVEIKYSNKCDIAQSIAILLLNQNSFYKMCDVQTNDSGGTSTSIRYTNKGSTQIQKRHLELMGYRVVEVSSMLWNSMYMMEPQAKFNFLKDKIWPSGSKTT